MRIPASSPNCSPHAKRFVRTVRTEYLDHFVIFGERHLRLLLRELAAHYLKERFHKGLGGQLIVPRHVSENDNSAPGAIRCRSRLCSSSNGSCPLDRDFFAWCPNSDQKCPTFVQVEAASVELKPTGIRLNIDLVTLPDVLTFETSTSNFSCSCLPDGSIATSKP